VNAATRETHTAVVVLVGERAYKVKKPVSLGFVDLSTREARRAACEREVSLNRRLAPDVYLGVAQLLDVDGTLCEDLVVMRRLPDEARLSYLVATKAPLETALGQIAHQLVAFHARAERGPRIDAQASAEAMASRFTTNWRRLEELPPSLHDPARSARVVELAQRYLAGRSRLFDERIARSRACDGHGDLLSDDVFLLPDGPRLLDCLEFDDALRYGDVLGDVAFLAMDLERLGRADLADFLLARYSELAGDTWPSSLAHLYIAYRAQVRALVAALRAHQGDRAEPEAARDLLRLALEHLEAGSVHLVLVGGPPGSGKSTLATCLANALDAAVLRSDELRKQTVGLDLDARAKSELDAGLYAPDITEATYTTLLDRARDCLERGVSVVLDATFADARWRQQATRLAAQVLANCTQLRCSLPEELARRRIAARSRRDASDATAEVAAALRARETPWPDAVRIDTSGAPDEVCATALGLVRQAASLRSPP
jgi:aminoglycoside phosphotransferase family enzyme/predicted kinase